MSDPVRIEPTIGRIVLFHPAYAPHHEPCAAIIAFVQPNGRLNLTAFNHFGAPWGVLDVVLVQEGEQPPVNSNWCEWMPYQKKVAAGVIEPTLHASPAEQLREYLAPTGVSK